MISKDKGLSFKEWFHGYKQDYCHQQNISMCLYVNDSFCPNTCNWANGGYKTYVSGLEKMNEKKGLDV